MDAAEALPGKIRAAVGEAPEAMLAAVHGEAHGVREAAPEPEEATPVPLHLAAAVAEWEDR